MGASKYPAFARLALPYGNHRHAENEGGREIPILSSRHRIAGAAGIFPYKLSPAVAKAVREVKTEESILLQEHLNLANETWARLERDPDHEFRLSSDQPLRKVVAGSANVLNRSRWQI